MSIISLNPANDVSEPFRGIPFNIFKTVQSKTPVRSDRHSVRAIAQALHLRPMYPERKDGAWLITFNAYHDREGGRGTANILHAYVVNGDWDEGFDQAVFDRGMAELSRLGAQVIAYQTYSHTPESPRWRIFVFLDAPVTPADYKTCWTGLNDIFEAKLDSNAKDCARLNYWPSCPPGQQREFLTLNIEEA